MKRRVALLKGLGTFFVLQGTVACVLGFAVTDATIVLIVGVGPFLLGLGLFVAGRVLQ